MADAAWEMQRLHRRSLIVFLVVAAAAGLAVVFFHEFFHERALPFFGLSHTAGDASGAVLLIMVTYLANRAVSYAVFEDPNFGADRLEDSRQKQRQNFLSAAAQVSSELSQVKGYNQVVRGQLQTIVGETEKAACDIASRLQTIDSVVCELNDLAGSTDLTLEAMTAKMLEGNQRLADMFMDVMASVQFQDVTRQQVEQVVDALDRLDRHATLLGERLHRFEDPEYVFQPLTEHLEQMYDSYVMNSQRDSHASALGAGNGAPLAAMRKIELF